MAVYRMHPLLPDEFTFRAVDDDRVLQTRTFPEVGALHTRERLKELSVANAIYSLGVANPGAITIHNYPNFLRNLKRPPAFGVEEIIDPRKTRSLLCEFARLAEPIRTPGPATSMTIRP